MEKRVEGYVYTFSLIVVPPPPFHASWQNNQYEEKLILFPVYVRGCGSRKHLDCITWQSTTPSILFYFYFFLLLFWGWAAILCKGLVSLRICLRTVDSISIIFYNLERPNDFEIRLSKDFVLFSDDMDLSPVIPYTNKRHTGNYFSQFIRSPLR